MKRARQEAKLKSEDAPRKEVRRSSRLASKRSVEEEEEKKKMKKSKAVAIAVVGPTLADVPHSVLKHLILPHVKDETVLLLSQTCKRLNRVCSSYLLKRSEELFPQVPPQVMNIVAKVRCWKMFVDLGTWIGWHFVRTFFRLNIDNWGSIYDLNTVGATLRATLVQFQGASAWYETDIALRKNADASGSIEERERRLNRFKGWRLLPDASVRFLEAYRLHGKESKQEIDRILNESVLGAELARRIADRTGKSPKLILEYFNCAYTENVILQAKRELFCFEKVVEAFEAGEEEKIFVKLRELDLIERISKFLKEELKVLQWDFDDYLDDLKALLRNLPGQTVIQAYLNQETSLENALEEILPLVWARWQEWWDATDLVEFRGFKCDSFVARAYDDQRFAESKCYMFVAKIMRSPKALRPEMMKRVELISELFGLGKVISGELEDLLTKFVVLEMNADQAEICVTRLTVLSRNSQFPSDYREEFFPKRLHTAFQDYLVGKIQLEEWNTTRKAFEAKKDKKIEGHGFTLELWRKYGDFKYSDEEWDEILLRLDVEQPNKYARELWQSFVKGELSEEQYVAQLQAFREKRARAKAALQKKQRAVLEARAARAAAGKTYVADKCVKCSSNYSAEKCIEVMCGLCCNNRKCTRHCFFRSSDESSSSSDESSSSSDESCPSAESSSSSPAPEASSSCLIS